MATRQYIGARYVPKFYTNSVDGSAAWESNVVYEPLIYVTLSNGHMYISKKQVPATVGIPSENTEYWLDIGSYNGISEELQQQIDQLVADLAETNGNVGDLTDLQTSDKTDLVSAINTLVHPKRKFIFIGDSYAEGVGSDTSTTPYQDSIASMFGLVTGDSFYHNEKGGASWKGLNGRKSFKTLLEELEITVTNKNDITDIVVCGGVNDAVGTFSEGLQGLDEFALYARTNYPNATVWVGMIGWSTNATTRTNILNVSKGIYFTSGYKGFQVLDLQYPVLHDYFNDFQSDGVHPTQGGQNKIAWAIAGALKGGKSEYSNPTTSEMTTDASFASTSLAIRWWTAGDDYVFTSGGRTLNAQSNTFPGWRQQIDLGVITQSGFFESLGDNKIGAVPATVGWNDGSVHLTACHALLQIKNRHLYCELWGPHDVVVTNFVYLAISPFTLQISRWLI